jgi:DNA-binding transcriptional ArsR family regulator
MVTPGKLRDAVADALGLGEQVSTIDVHLRNLRENGLIAKNKRGRGAAEMGPGDAVALLMAVAGSQYVRESVSTVRRYSKLRFDNTSPTFGKSIQAGSIDRILPLLSLPVEHVFEDALRQILIELGSGSLFGSEVRQELVRLYGNWKTSSEYLFVTLFSPYAAATIQYGVRPSFHMQIVYGSLPVTTSRGASELRNFKTEGVLLTARTIDRVALSRIAAAIA